MWRCKALDLKEWINAEVVTVPMMQYASGSVFVRTGDYNLGDFNQRHCRGFGKCERIWL